MSAYRSHDPVSNPAVLQVHQGNRPLANPAVHPFEAENIFFDARKRKFYDFMKKFVCSPSTSSTQMIDSTSGSSSTDISDENEIRIIETLRRSGKKFQQMRGHLQNLATACDRTEISDRSDAFIVNVALLDSNVIGTDDSSKVIDRSKIRRERKKVRKHLQYAEDNKIITAIYFDDRKDKTLVMTTRTIQHIKKLLLRSIFLSCQSQILNTSVISLLILEKQIRLKKHC
ncbi:hypothetical protein HELRODRAFT_166845 [Helobdella robusta]|uniref:Uncharacterized protein n=1 Tax=Helobdella robusta TaxID=6412 RepID=T1EYM2_HELRO|nr:hypothetical protein HELRODRAFT_166845 [Helobdella robusta]ESO11798.1 hypothetical protein HELRODRAFT_166845 [Helobdella robusta]